MNTYLLPVDDEFVEHLAKTIARNRMSAEASDTIEQWIGIPIEQSELLETAFNAVFEELWTGGTELDERQRDLYRGDALAVIRAINLKLTTGL